MPPATAPPTAPARLPPVTAEPPMPPIAAPVAVLRSVRDMWPQPASAATAIAAASDIAVFIRVSLKCLESGEPDAALFPDAVPFVPDRAAGYGAADGSERAAAAQYIARDRATGRA